MRWHNFSHSWALNRSWSTTFDQKWHPVIKSLKFWSSLQTAHHNNQTVKSKQYLVSYNIFILKSTSTSLWFIEHQPSTQHTIFTVQIKFLSLCLCGKNAPYMNSIICGCLNKILPDHLLCCAIYVAFIQYSTTSYVFKSVWKEFSVRFIRLAWNINKIMIWCNKSSKR